ncbi:hypothetical protein CRI70_21710 [Streptomyces sp. Ru87]|nr:hypothetical protein CRI70_21710 [Streptomyces sp. Ru87]
MSSPGTSGPAASEHIPGRAGLPPTPRPGPSHDGGRPGTGHGAAGSVPAPARLPDPAGPVSP